MHPSRWEEMPIVSIEENERGILHVTTEGFAAGPHRIHLQHHVPTVDPTIIVRET